MFSTEVVAVSAARGQPALRNVTGFGWNPSDSRNSIPAGSLLQADVEYDTGDVKRCAVRPGAWYPGNGRVMTRVWLTCPTAGVAVVDVTMEDDGREGLSPPSPPLRAIVRGWEEFPAATPMANVTRDFVNPDPEVYGRFRLHMTFGGTLSGGGWAFGIYQVHDNGVEVQISPETDRSVAPSGGFVTTPVGLINVGPDVHVTQVLQQPRGSDSPLLGIAAKLYRLRFRSSAGSSTGTSVLEWEWAPL